MFASTTVLTLMGLSITVGLAAPALQHAVGNFDDWTPPQDSHVVVAPSILDRVVNAGLRNSSAGDGMVVAMETAMHATYQALPKNKHGLLSHSAAAKLLNFSCALCTADACPACFRFNRVCSFATMFSSARMLTLMGLSSTVCFAAPALRHAVGHFDDWAPPEDSYVVVASSILHRVINEGLRNSSAGDTTIVAMETAMQATYQALPKNKHGLLSRNAAAYLVQKYTMQVYGYSIRGLGSDPADAQTTTSNHPNGYKKLRQKSAPEVLLSLLESRQGGHGFALRDTASLAVMIKKLVMDLDAILVYKAFHTLTSLDGFIKNEDELTDLSIKTVLRVIQAWDWLHWHYFETEKDVYVEAMNAPTHVMDEFGKLAMTLIEAKFYRERHSRNPFKEKRLSMADTLQLAHETTQSMGMWQDHDCKAEKRFLIKLDPDNDGRVPLDIMYNQPETTDSHGEQIFRFSESQDYLRGTGGSVLRVIQAWDWLHWHDFGTEKDFFVEAMTAPTHVMDEFGKLAMTLIEAKFYRERHSRNPFKEKRLSMADTLQLAHEATQSMGLWQDHDCKAEKRFLIKLDPDNDGRVPLGIVYNQPETTDSHGEQIFRFSESQDYLRGTGGLDESDPSHPKVIISNYVLGPANCYESVTFHTFCCLNDCDALLTEVEGVVGGPSVKPDVLLPLLGNLTTPSMDEPRPFATSLVEKLSGIAAHSGGMVPLHGRLFTQWLHFAFPHECPYPHITQKDGAGNALTTSYFQGAADSMAQWTDEEMLPLVEVDNYVIFGYQSILSTAFMLLAMGAMWNQVRTLSRCLQTNVMGPDVEKGL
eukprot:CAMPEP_0172779606 /NCGR_PEP_ID=MMETSP1074-20121228/202504_1 /TAXON_ID=2916 /ORGANISM="Ceratium fusus, Strain PA161109" /LENGTH=816 /DNA_ID=CAMNT_0013616571 /DNA_START=77 /DNA_END=2527 /DNA_ORIENTATION=-